MHPPRPPRRFFALVADEDKAFRVSFRFEEANDALSDAHGNSYVVGSIRARTKEAAGDEWALWSYDRELRLRWLRYIDDDGRLALVKSGTCLLLYGDTTRAFDTQTGADVDVGGRNDAAASPPFDRSRSSQRKSQKK